MSKLWKRMTSAVKRKSPKHSNPQVSKRQTNQKSYRDKSRDKSRAASPQLKAKAFIPLPAMNLHASKHSVQHNSVPTKLPCVPTPRHAHKSCLATAQPAQKSAKRSRRVQFAADVKVWDGMRPENDRLQRAVKEYWQREPKIDTLRTLYTNLQEDALRALRDMFARVIKRVQQNRDSTAIPLLPEGGGQGIKFNQKHLRRMQTLYGVMCCVHNKCVQAIQIRIQNSVYY